MNEGKTAEPRGKSESGMMRWIFRIFMALVACVVAALALLFMLPSERVGQLASDQLEKQTGRKLTLTGDFKPTLYPILGVKTGKITISNADWASDPQMITANSATVGVNLMALIGGGLEIEKLELTDPQIYLERAADGRVNWDLGLTGEATAEQEGTDSAGVADLPTLKLGRITNGRVVYLDQVAGETTDVSGITGTLALPKGADKAAVDLKATLDGREVSIVMDVENWAEVMNKGASAIEGTLSYAKAEVDFDGTLSLAGNLPTVVTKFSLIADNPSEVAMQLGVTLPSQITPLRKAKLGGQLQISDAGLYLDAALDAFYAGTGVQGKVSASTDDAFVNNPVVETTVDLNVAKTATLAFDGVVGAGKELATGKITAKAQDLRKLLSLVDVSLSTPADTLKTGAVSGQVKLSQDGVLRLGGVTLTLDQNTVSGDINLDTAGIPTISATLRGEQLDFSAFTADGQKGDSNSGGARAAQQGWSREPLSLQGLDAVNADVTLKAKGINLGTTQLGGTHVAVMLQGGKMTIKMIDVRAYQGAMAGTISLRGGDTVAFVSDVKARDVQLEPMLGELLDMDRLRGSGDVTLNLSGQGGSLHQVMNALSGNGNVKFGKGAIRGIDLAAMMRNLKKAFGGFEGATEFSSLTGSFEITKGVLQNVDLSLISPLFKAKGKGSIDLGGQAMNYVITPTSLSEGAEFSVPVTISGSWRDLTFRPDLDKLINLVLEQKLIDSEAAQRAKAKLEEAQAKLANPEETIKEEIRKKVAEEIGADADSLEDEVKKKLEDEVGNALKKLFN